MSLTDYPREMASRNPSQITLHRDTEEGFVYTRRKYISGETHKTAVSLEEDYKEVEWRENGSQR